MVHFNALFNLLLHYLPDSTKVPKISLLTMFFMKIRLNLFDEDIGYRFGVHPSTVSRNFHHVLDVIAARTAHLIKWPNREVLCYNGLHRSIRGATF